MRYLAEYDLFFIHIPKNGGQSVRNAMARIAPLSFAPLAADLGVTEAEAQAASESGLVHRTLGPLHPAHLPLWAMAAEFPASWTAFQSAASFALTRDPRDRFLSALMQRLKEFRGAGQITAQDRAVRDEAKSVCDWLSKNPRPLKLDYIHFCPQVDFVDLEGTRRVSAVFPMRAMAEVETWIAARTGLAIEITHDHARRQPKPWARVIQPAARFAGRRLMPQALKRALHPLWMASGLFAPAAKGYGAVDLGADVEAFIASYYAADARLHAEAQARLAAPASVTTQAG